MGCIYSKTIGRSMSIRDDLNHGFQSSSVAWEEFLTSNSGTDQLFALVRSANNTLTKPRTSNYTLPETYEYLADAWDRIPEINESKSTPHDSGVVTRSKSYDEIMRENENDGMNGNKLMDWKGKSSPGSRSFHTVEEYEALFESTRKFSTRSVQHFEDCCSSDGDVKLKQTNDLYENRNHGSLGNIEDFEKVVRVNGTRETGWRRKTMAKGLKPLDVSTIEFPNIGKSSHQVHVEAGQVYSPGTYVTPKFGSYNKRGNSRIQVNGNGESSIFSQELVAAFEDCMQRLQDEEESILWEMDGRSTFHDVMENRVEEIPSNMTTDI